MFSDTRYLQMHHATPYPYHTSTLNCITAARLGVPYEVSRSQELRHLPVTLPHDLPLKKLL